MNCESSPTLSGIALHHANQECNEVRSRWTSLWATMMTSFPAISMTSMPVKTVDVGYSMKAFSCTNHMLCRGCFCDFGDTGRDPVVHSYKHALVPTDLVKTAILSPTLLQILLIARKTESLSCISSFLDQSIGCMASRRRRHRRRHRRCM